MNDIVLVRPACKEIKSTLKTSFEFHASTDATFPFPPRHLIPLDPTDEGNFISRPVAKEAYCVNVPIAPCLAWLSIAGQGPSPYKKYQT